MDWFEWGLVGGFFGKDAVNFLRRYRLRIIFIVSAIGTDLFLFSALAWDGGLKFAWGKFAEKAFTLIGILLPLGIGALCVLCVALCAPGLVGKSKEENSKEQ